MAARQAGFTETREILCAAGIPVAGTVAGGRGEAVEAACRWGFPAVMKLLSPDIVHKSDAGAVILDIESAEEAGVAYDALMERAGAPAPRASKGSWSRSRPSLGSSC